MDANQFNTRGSTAAFGQPKRGTNRNDLPVIDPIMNRTDQNFFSSKSQVLKREKDYVSGSSQTNRMPELYINNNSAV